jgi:hypothetical protein
MDYICKVLLIMLLTFNVSMDHTLVVQISQSIECLVHIGCY